MSMTLTALGKKGGLFKVKIIRSHNVLFWRVTETKIKTTRDWA